MQLQKENHKLQEDVIRLKSERSRLQNKVLHQVLITGGFLTTNCFTE